MPAANKASHAPPPKLLLLSRPGCHLCEEFRDALEAAFPGKFELRESCVDDRPEWRERHGHDIPVLLAPDGSVVCRARFDAKKLRAHLEES